MTCRIGCGACCIAISISSSIPGMPRGKKAGERCVNLDENFSCRIHGKQDYPKVCRELRPDLEMCGHDREEAMVYLENLERLTAPG